MRISSYSEFRRNLAAAIDRVNSDHEPLIITRDHGKPMAVLVSLEDFSSYEEMRRLLRNAKNPERLLEAIGELDRMGARNGRLPGEAGKATAKVMPSNAGATLQTAAPSEAARAGARE